MSTLKFYQPHSFSFPLSPNSENPWGGDQNIIYDVARTSPNNIVLFCANFQHEWLESLEIFVNQQVAQHEICTHSPFPYHFNCHIKVPIPSDLVHHEPIDLIISAQGIQHHCRVESMPFHKIKKVELTLMTLQKDNPLCWIKDWCLYYHRVHGVDLIVLYDNGSANRSEIVQGLYQLSPGLEIILIDWCFAYSMAVQVGALNHCHTSLGSRSHYYLNFDLDEYLIYAKRHKLIDYLDKKISGKSPILHVPGKIISNIQPPDVPLDSIVYPRVKDFCYKHRFCRHTDEKTIFRYQEGVFIHIHYHLEGWSFEAYKHYITGAARGKKMSWHRQLRTKVVDLALKIKGKIRGLIYTILFYPYQYPYHPYFHHYASLIAGRRQRDSARDDRRPYYNHYAFLTLFPNRGWRQERKEPTQFEAYNPRLHCQDIRMARMLEVASLTDSESEK